MTGSAHQSLGDDALDTLFRTARTANAWTDAPFTDADCRALYDLLKFGPTSANCSPARFVFCRSDAAKAKLAACADAGNRAKILSAPTTAIVGMDFDFYERLPELFPHADARAWFAGQPAKIADTAFRNATLQGAYLILAARALGFDCGPYSGFDKVAVDAAFWAGTRVETDFLCAIGHGDPAGLFPRSPRLGFEDAARIL